MAIEVLVLLSGGVVQSVYSNEIDVDLEIIDLDDFKELPDYKKKEEELDEILDSAYRIY